MNTTLPTTRTRSFARQPLTALGWTTLLALVGLSLCLVYLVVVLIGVVIPPLLVFAALSLVMAGLVATGWRWTPILGAVWSGFLLAGNSAELQYNLAHPALLHSFIFTVVMGLTSLVGIIAGIGAGLQNYRQATPRNAPRWLPYALTTLGALGLGAILTAIPQAGASAGISAEALAELPAVTTPGLSFDRTEIRAKVGETVALRLDNTDSQGHSFDIDAFNIHVPMPAGDSALALFQATTPGTYTFYCGIPAHRDVMVGTLVVDN